MDYEETIRSKLQGMILEGMTQEEIAAKTGVTQSHISKLLRSPRGKQKKNIGLDTFFKLFPNAKIIFGDEHHMGNVTNNSGQVVNGDMTAEPSTMGEEEFLRKIMSSNELDADTKVKIYNIVKGEKL